MRIREITTERVETVAPSMPPGQAAGFRRALRGHHLIVNDGSTMNGSLSTRDLTRAGTAHDGGVVRGVMSSTVATVDEGKTVRTAANAMRGRSISCLVARRNRRMAGIVTVSDLLTLLKRALETPTRQIAENSGVDGGVVVDRMISGTGAYGFDASRGIYVDLIETGIIDPTKVVRAALENAVSVASVLLLTEATLTEVPDPKAEPAQAAELS